jgi:hypothetical protein
MLRVELRKLTIEITRQSLCLPFRLAGYHNDRAILCNFDSRDLETSGKHRFCDSSHIAFFKQTRPAHVKSDLMRTAHFGAEDARFLP